MTQRAMARVHLHGAVGGAGERGGRAVLDDVALEVAQQGGRHRDVVGLRPHDDRGAEAADEAGRLEHRTPPRAHQRVSVEGVVGDVAPAGDQMPGVERRRALPGARRRGHHEHVDIADRAEGVEHRELGGGEGAGTEQRGALRDGRHELPGP